MKTKECPSCAMEVDANAKVCPICQFEFPKRSSWITWMAIFLVIIWLLSYII
ncbi:MULTISPECIES: zinc ribbon domain-containing protein [Algoriphagus]|uniref:zinc ribbon domain-containing protein n=1 Tax=Algoriphagus TaxID=246875 RepID=UPI000DAE5C9B|nr:MULTISPECIES: zinc ribbon domain-containing protein [Algoriphagus]